MRCRILSEVLYRKWRPGTLTDLVGQDHISKTLRNAVDSDRVSHAYLFCGPRGTGKTSTARILAKAINCESPNEGEPDNVCSQCEDINSARALDLIEIDGASNRRIADIRELSEKIHYSPTNAKKKVYIIDEVHMLTQEAFNALLKTLEEPPAHAVLILATTDVQKVPATIVSRCQRFDFKRISIDSISDKLQLLCNSEKVTISSEALDLIARKSTGSLRDAENFLEQAIVSFGSEITLDNLLEFFNIDDNQFPIQIIIKIVESDLKAALTLLADSYQDGKDADQILLNMIDISRTLILVKSKAISEKDLGESVWDSLSSVAAKLEMSDLVNMAKVLSDAQKQHSVTPTFPLEVAIADIFTTLMTDSGTEVKTKTIVESPKTKIAPKHVTPTSGSSLPTTPTAKPVLKEYDKNPEKPEPVLSNSPLVNSADDTTTSTTYGSTGDLDSKWNDILKSLRKTGSRFNLAALLRGCHGKGINGDSIVLKFKHVSHMERLKTELDNPTVSAELNKVIQDMLAKEYKIQIELLDDNRNDNQSPSQKSHLVKTVQALGGRIVEERGK